MAAHGSVRSSAYDHVERSQYFQGHMAGMSAHERHTKLVSDYQRFYQNSQLSEPTEAKPIALVSTDFDALRQGHRFLRSEADDAESSWEAKLAKRYYARLYKEYAVADLSRYQESKVGLRWRTQAEVVSGKGQFTCGCKGCLGADGLCSYEVNFAYVEAGQKKQALVKLRLCLDCGYKLNWRKEKQYAKAAQKKRRREEVEGLVTREQDVPAEPASNPAPGSERTGASEQQTRGRDGSEMLPEMYDNANSVAPPPGPSAVALSGAAAAVKAAGQATDAQRSKGLAGSDAVWESKPALAEVSAEDEMDQYLLGLFE